MTELGFQSNFRFASESLKVNVLTSLSIMEEFTGECRPKKSPHEPRALAIYWGILLGIDLPNCLQTAFSSSRMLGWCPSVRLYIPHSDPFSRENNLPTSVPSIMLRLAAPSPIDKYLLRFSALIIAPRFPGGFGPAINGKRSVKSLTPCFSVHSWSILSASNLLFAYGVAPRVGYFSQIFSPRASP